MRTLSILVLGACLLVSGVVRAECERDGIKLWPAPTSAVPTNVNFLLEGIGKEQERVAKLVGKTLALTSGKDSVSVQVRPGYRSEVGRVAVWLVPTVPLARSRKWGLALDGVLHGADLLNWHGKDVLYPTWRVASRPDTAPPRFKTAPAAVGGFNEKGARGVRFRFELVEESPSFLIATVRRAIGSTALQRYPILVSGGEAVVGHDACSGGFAFEDGRAYRALFEAVDSAGNRSLLSDPIEFKSPMAEGP